MAFSFVDLIGYFGLAINLFSMYLKGEKRLRKFSLTANCIYIVYGFCLLAFPIIIGSTIAVLLHSYRLYKIHKEAVDFNK